MGRWLYHWLILICLTGCDPFTNSASAFETYQKRLQNILDMPETDPAESLPEHWPSVRNRHLSSKSPDINLLQFLSLYGCDLQVVVGEKNAILGKVMQPLNELRYSLRFINAAEQCQQMIEAPDLQQILAEATEQKKAQLPVIIWQAGWASDEFASLFNLSGSYLNKETGMRDVTGLVNDFAYLSETTATILRFPFNADLARWGEIHQRWQYQQTMGSLIKTTADITQQLTLINQQLEQRLQRQPICYRQQPSALGKQLHAMFQSLYIEEIQPYLSLVSRQRDRVLPAVASFYKAQQVNKPPEVRTYYQNYLSADSVFWKNFDTSVKQHTRLWQKMLEQCGLRPVAK